jgi:hypothetical protein
LVCLPTGGPFIRLWSIKEHLPLRGTFSAVSFESWFHDYTDQAANDGAAKVAALTPEVTTAPPGWTLIGGAAHRGKNYGC